MHDPRIPRVATDEADTSLVDGFLSLTPEQRLGELESRVGFLLSLRGNDEPQLPRGPGDPE